MEIGAVKQAFNNELVLLKKKMNQAKIQIIHKLTRKAKTLSQKKTPDHLKNKLSRKVESAVKEVLVIKKINPKELARFAVTHKGSLNDYLNKPNVDNDKACARLLLHKSLQDKYNLLRIRFSSVSIEELLMSREERKKLKKEEREKRKQKNKDNLKQKTEVVNAEGEWAVEDIESPDKLNLNDSCEESDVETKCVEPSENKIMSGVESIHSEIEENIYSDNKESEKNEELDVDTFHNSESDSDYTTDSKRILNSDISNSDEEELQSGDTGKFVRLPCNRNEKDSNSKENDNVNKNIMIDKQNKRKTFEKKGKSKQDKNKNLNEKLISRKFKKEIYEDSPAEVQTKVVDPFFITSTGENYMSVVEPRAPDEIKEVHKQGNRKVRRAAMFGHTPKIKPRRDAEFDNNRFGGQYNDTKHKVNTKNCENNTKILNNNRNQFDSDNRNSINKRNNFSKVESDTIKPEKLHPSWEAKKRQSGILPFQGKKIVFDES
ncbi:hypothetical protein ACJJTC_017925 [Scirpophaga incertulas]